MQIYDCKKLIDKDVCNKGYAWNPNNCEREFDKSCHVDEYLNYSDCKCRKKLTDKLIDNALKLLKKQNQSI